MLKCGGVIGQCNKSLNLALKYNVCDIVTCVENKTFAFLVYVENQKVCVI